MTGSVASVKGFPGFGVYSASKAALRSFARTWLNELKGRNIRLNLLSPGADGHIGFPTSRQGDEGDVRIPDPEGKDGSSCTQLMTTGQCTHYERAPCLRRQSASATHACGGFAPTPQDLALWCLSRLGVSRGPDSGRGTQEHPPVSVEATESALGLLPSIALSSAQFGLILLRRKGVFAAGSGSMTLDLGGSGPSEESLSPQGGTQHAE